MYRKSSIVDLKSTYSDSMAMPNVMKSREMRQPEFWLATQAERVPVRPGWTGEYLVKSFVFYWN
jgi:hypothetical protein